MWLPLFTFPSTAQLRQMPTSPPILAPANLTPKPSRTSNPTAPILPTPNGFQAKGADWADRLARDRFGQAVALSADGQTLAIGAPHNYTNGHGRGAVQVYRAIGGTWQPIGEKFYGPRPMAFFGWAVALSADGQTLAIAAPGNSATGPQSGAVHIHRYQNQTWVPWGQTLTGNASLDLSGAAIALSADGQTIAIGAPRSDQGGPNAGQVQVYRQRNDRWETLGDRLTGIQSEGHFGTAIALSADGHTLAIGAAFTRSTNGPDSGAVHLYDYAADRMQWQTRTVLQGEQAGDLFGHAIALTANGQTLAVSAIGSQNQRGQVQLFQKVDQQWQSFGGPITGQTKNDGLGDRLAIAGDGRTLSISTSPDVTDPSRKGHVQSYRWIDGQWVTISHLSETGEFGTGLALSQNGNRLAIGAPGNEQTLDDSGRVRLFDYVNQPPQLQLPSGPQPYRRHQPPLAFSQAAQLRDDSDQWQGSQLSVTIAQAEPGEQLTLKPFNSKPWRLTPSEIWIDNQVIGTYQRRADRFDLRLNERARTGDLAALLQGFHYDRDSIGLSSTDRQIQFQLTDRDGGTSTAVTRLKPAQSNALLLRHRRNHHLRRVTIPTSPEAPIASTEMTQAVAQASTKAIQLTGDWRLVTSADLDQNGMADLVLHSRQQDEVQIWYLNANGEVQPRSLRDRQGSILRTGNRDWQVIGLADLNGDRELDLVWQNPTADAVAVWYLDRQQQVTSYDVLRDRQGNRLQTGNSRWQIQGIADFDGDGDRDLLYRLPELNHTAIVRLDQGTFIDSHLLAAAPSATWTIAATADGNGDGMSDLYWQSADRRQAKFQAMRLNGGRLVGETFSDLGITTPLAAIGDLNQDTIPDLLLEATAPNFTLSPHQWDQNAMVSQPIDLKVLGADWEVIQINAFGED